MRKLFILLMILAMFSCWGKTQVMQILDPEVRSFVPADEVRVYRSANQIPYPYDEIAILFSYGTQGGQAAGKLLKSLKQEAGKLGANAVIVDTEKGQIAVFVHYKKRD